MRRPAWRFALPMLAMLVAGPAAAEPLLADIVKKIYEQAALFCNGEDVAPPYTDKFMREVFDKPVADRYLARLHKSQVDFDIFVDGQDCKLTDLVIEPLEATAATAVVRARFNKLVDGPRDRLPVLPINRCVDDRRHALSASAVHAALVPEAEAAPDNAAQWA
jgi:hypothetical protein